MNNTRLHTLMLSVACIAALTFAQGSRTAQAAIPGCASNYSVDVTMTIGARWEMCWDKDAQRGLMLSQVTFTPKSGTRRLVLGAAALAQVYVAYDNGGTQQHLLTEGGLALAPLSAAECPGGTLRQDAAGTSTLCQKVQARGYAWRGTAQVQGQSLVLFTVSNNGTDTFIHQWAFDDDGTIRPMLGVTGRLNPNQTSSAATGWALGSGNSRYATHRFVTAYWRLNFDLDGSANDAVDEFNYSGTGNTRTQTVTRFTTEQARTIAPDAQRFWRVADKTNTNSNGGSHYVSYQIVPHNTAVQRGSEAFTRNDVYVTNNAACEQFASRNPTTGGCGAQATDFANGQTLGNDLVVWLGNTWHHVPADEDEPAMRTHWQGWVLMPRDFHPTSPL